MNQTGYNPKELNFGPKGPLANKRYRKNFTSS